MGWLGVLGVVGSLLVASLAFILFTDLELSSITPHDILTSTLTSAHILLGYRLFCFILVIRTLLVILTDPIGLKITVPGRGGGLQTVTLNGYERLSTFTVWSWILIGIYFGLTSTCGIMNSIGLETSIPLILLQLSWILYELSFPISFLITIIVSFVLIPPAIARGTHQPLFSTPSLLMHNANVIMMTLENLLNIIPFSYSHAVFGVLYGLLYAVFAWGWYHHKGVFYYFFLDYEFKGAELWYLGLILVLLVFHSLGVFLYQMEQTHNPLVYLGLIIGVFSILKLKP